MDSIQVTSGRCTIRDPTDEEIEAGSHLGLGKGAIPIRIAFRHCAKDPDCKTVDRF